ncbi:EscU/YscU/HrcU family type III secretion system export apparatus switch protein [Celerinatantimonas sp. MCCC 1A17872]|uniref:EscU/YscU/HrcU family type III secretion system export apparatus switch protein n=1 Tax=Celerinatantimonas sp. MCCC 1A17872 TaxID=3177514 RepID=UPI0038BEC3B3
MSEKEQAAVALGYDGKNAPKVVAKGYNQLAQEIITAAKNAGIMVYEDKQLLAMLDQLSLDEQIPQSLYIIIAELISFSYVLQGKFPDHWNNIHAHIDDKV